jgi:hypothetical protein
MDKKQKEIILAPILIVIAIISVSLTIKKATRYSPRSVPAQNLAVEPTNQPRIDIKDKLISPSILTFPTGTEKQTLPKAKEETEEVKYNVENLVWGRDPFVLDKATLFSSDLNQGRVAKLEQLSRLKLTGMIISADKPADSIAIINGENFKVGDSISGFLLKEIKQNSVTLYADNEDYELNLWEEEVGKDQAPANQPK